MPKFDFIAERYLRPGLTTYGILLHCLHREGGSKCSPRCCYENPDGVPR